MTEDNSQRLTLSQQLQYNFLEQHNMAAVISLHMFERIQAQIENHYGDDKNVACSAERVG